jgi:hypothetical protein
VDLRLAIPEEHVSADVLNPMLEASTRLAQRMIRNGQVPLFDEALKKGQVKWAPEPPGAERFDHPLKVIGRGWGDCDDLAPWQCASDRETGKDPGCKSFVRKSGPGLWHAVTKMSDGSVRDPSREAGMGSHSEGIGAAVVGAMFHGPAVVGGESRPYVAFRRVVNSKGEVGYDARVDLPWKDSPGHAFSAFARKRDPRKAVIDAIVGSCLVGAASGAASREHVARLDAIASLIDGQDPRKLIHELGESAVVGAIPFVARLQHVVGFNFGKFLKVLEPMASLAVSFVPGVGPIASKAMDITTAVLSKQMNPMQALQSGLNAVAPQAAQTTMNLATSIPGLSNVLPSLNISLAPPPGQPAVYDNSHIAPAGVQGDAVGWNLFHAISHFAGEALHAVQHIAKDLGPFGVIAATMLGIPPDPVLMGGIAAALLHAHAGDKHAKEHLAAIEAKGPQYSRLVAMVADKVKAHPQFATYRASVKKAA